MSAEPGPATDRYSPEVRRLCRYLSDRSPQPMVAVEGPRHVVSYLNPAFARLVGKAADELISRPFAEAVPEGEANGCLALLDRVYRTGGHEVLPEQEHREPRPAFWSYSVWAILGADERPAGVMIQVTDATEIATFRARAAAMNEALLVSSVRLHELAEAAEAVNAQLQEAHVRLEGRVAERTAELAGANALLTSQIRGREASEAGRRDLLRRLATSQEDERRRIARDLHDQMGQYLAALGLGLKALEAGAPESSPAGQKLRQLRDLSDLIGTEVHNLALEIRPTALDDLGLSAALGTYAEDWGARTGVRVDFQTVGIDGERLPPAVETAVYRVVQEALTNVHRHARARRVSLVLQRTSQGVIAVVEDDGAGFDPTTAPQAAGRLGVLGMRERVELVDGHLTVESAPGGGTTIIARIPLPGEGRGE